MRIPNTELDYEEPDEVALKRYLGGLGENIDQWAQRVWTLCEAKSKEIPIEELDVIPDPIPEILPRVYKAKSGQSWKDRAKELWENKKYQRKLALGREFGFNSLPSNAQIMQMKVHSKYKTRDQLDAESR